MIKKISIKQLRPGMYVHDLNCGWMDHPFLASKFKVKNRQMIAKIAQNGIREFYIDTSKGLDVKDASTKQEAQNEVQKQVEQIAHQEEVPTKQVPLKDELVQAKKIQHEAARVAENVMEDVRLGKQISVEAVNPVVNQMVTSVFRNKDALLSLGRIRNMDQYTFEHSVGVSVLLISFAKTLGLEQESIQEIGIGALLHDIGKIKVPDAILNKPDRLTEQEFEIIKRHAQYSRELLEETPGIPATAISIAAEHHERYDGSGYPHRLKGDEISHYGQMAAIVDVYDAMTADRVYHQGLQPAIVLRKMMEWSKFHFNAKLVQQFIQCVGIYPLGSLVRLESGRLAVVIESGTRNLLRPLVKVVYDTKRQQHLTPRELDLSAPAPNSGNDRIVSAESPEKWGIKPEDFTSM
ncbi:MAG: HD-GYP domain-containing protein [Gammaproteobacteria bacterium]|nr:HD-GYP domain-containing protein [Gammaproteobacteria bacterium]